MIYLLVAVFFNVGFSQTEKIIGAEMNHLLIKEVDGVSYDLDRRLGFYLGAEFHHNRIILSYTTYDSQSSNGLSSIYSENNQMALMYKRQVYTADNDVWKTYFGFGLGQAWSDVETRLGSSAVLSKGKKQLLAILDIEVSRRVYKNLWYSFSLSALSSEAYSLNPTLDVSLIKLYFFF